MQYISKILRNIGILPNFSRMQLQSKAACFFVLLSLLYPPWSASSPSPAVYTTGSPQEELAPTVKAANPFNSVEDAKILRKAFRKDSWKPGTDEEPIIELLTKRTNNQRLQIAESYKTLYNTDLITDLKDELSGSFEDLIVALVKPLSEFLASAVHKAIRDMHLKTQEKTLVEILYTRSNADIIAIKDAYEKLFSQPMETLLISDTSGNFTRYLVPLVQGRRSENYDVNSVSQDAQALMTAESKHGDEITNTFTNILITRSYAQVGRVLVEYQRISGKPLRDTIASKFSGDIMTGLLAIVKYVEDKAFFFAERIHESLEGAGTNNEKLIRIVVSRSEIDLERIRKAYSQHYGTSLDHDIEEDTAGDYEKTLRALIRGY